jgi:microcompartment protein CcmK/EutM
MSGLTPSQRAAIAAAEAEIARIITALSNEHRLIVQSIDMRGDPDGVEIVAFDARELGE